MTSRLTPSTLTRVAAEDVALLAVLAPLGVLFQLLLVLAQGYYAMRRRGRIATAGYVGAIVLAFAALVRAARR